MVVRSSTRVDLGAHCMRHDRRRLQGQVVGRLLGYPTLCLQRCDQQLVERSQPSSPA